MTIELDVLGSHSCVGAIYTVWLKEAKKGTMYTFEEFIQFNDFTITYQRSLDSCEVFAQKWCDENDCKLLKV